MELSEREMLSAILKNQELMMAEIKRLHDKFDKLERDQRETHRRTLFLETKFYDEAL